MASEVGEQGEEGVRVAKCALRDCAARPFWSWMEDVDELEEEEEEVGAGVESDSEVVVGSELDEVGSEPSEPSSVHSPSSDPSSSPSSQSPSSPEEAVEVEVGSSVEEVSVGVGESEVDEEELDPLKSNPRTSDPNHHIHINTTHPTPGSLVIPTSCSPSGIGPPGFALQLPAGLSGLLIPNGIVPAAPTASPPTNVVASSPANWHWKSPASSGLRAACWQ